MAGGSWGDREPTATSGGTDGPRRLEVGVVLPTFPQASAPDIRTLPEVARQAEAAGVDALWTCDHLFWHGPVFECLTAAAVAVTATSRCRVGTAVLQLPLRSPAVVAKTSASLQQLSGGRFVLGVGSGIHEGEFEVAGADYSRRGRHLDQQLDRMAQIWAGGSGRYEQRPVPERVPVWIGGSSVAARRRAVQRGDGWIPMFVSPESLRRRFKLLDAELVAAGRSAAAVARALLLFVAAGSNSGDDRRAVDWVASLYALPADKVSRHVITGAADLCVERIAEYVDLGVEHICLFVADDDPLPHVEALLPGLRALGRQRVALAEH